MLKKYRKKTIAIDFCLILLFCFLYTACGKNDLESNGRIDEISKNNDELIKNSGEDEEDRSDQINDNISCNERILNDKLWYGTVQIESIVVPYNEVKLSSFEKLGYELQLEQLESDDLFSKQYDEIVKSNRISIVKDGLEVIAYLQDDSMDSSYRDAVIKYVEYIIYRNDNFNIPIWVCGGIQFGDNIDELPEYTDVSAGWKEQSVNGKTLNFLVDLQGEPLGFSAAEPIGNYFNWAEEEEYPVWGPPKITLYADDNHLINIYHFEHGAYVAQTQDKIEYQLETYQLDNGKKINCPTIAGTFVSYRDRYGGVSDKYSSQVPYITNACFYEKGNSYAYVTLTLLQDNQVYGCSNDLLVYKGENYSVYQICFNHNRFRDEKNLAYLFCLIRDDDVYQETPINFDLVIWDNTGKMIPEFREQDSYTLFSENTNLQTDYYENSFSRQLAIDIFDHIAQYTVE